MQITRAGEYAVMGVTCLARRPMGEAVMIQEVCREERIPRSFVAKIFQVLTKAGIVRSQRGVRGGFALAREPGQITILEVIEAVEGRLAFDRRLQEPASCQETHACALCDLFSVAQQHAKEIMRVTTLADLTRPKTTVLRRIRKEFSPQNGATPRQTRIAAHPTLS